MSANYNATCFADSPSLFWDVNEAEATNNLADASGNGNTGKRYTNQVVGGAGWSSGFWVPLVTGDSGKSDLCLANWSGDPAVQSYPGTGYRADTYKPFISGSARSFECILKKVDPNSFATIFSGADIGVPFGADTAHPTWEMGRVGPGAPDNPQMMRFYPRVGTFPAGFVDWGTANTDHPDTTFQMQTSTHIVCTYDDAIGIAEWWVNGHSMGRQGPNGYAGVPLAYSTTHDPGVFQFGWRGNTTPPNTEVYGGFVDKIAVYEQILSPTRIWAHFAEMAPVVAVPAIDASTAVILEKVADSGAVSVPQASSIIAA